MNDFVRSNNDNMTCHQCSYYIFLCVKQGKEKRVRYNLYKDIEKTQQISKTWIGQIFKYIIFDMFITRTTLLDTIKREKSSITKQHKCINTLD